MYDRVLIAVDGSEEAKHAAGLGLELARAFDAEAVVLHVIERSALRLTRSTQKQQRLRERGEAILDEIAELAVEIDHPVTTELAEGSPAARIAASDADLVVVGRQGLTGLGRRLLGGVTERVLARSDCPVLVVPDGDAAPTDGLRFDRLLVPTDGSENAARATGHAVAIAERYDAAVHVLNVVDLQSAGGVFNAGVLERAFIERLEEAGSTAADRLAADLRDALPDRPVETAVVRTDSFDGAAAGIRTYAEENAIDLVVLGSHGRSNLAWQVIGSVASTVLRTVEIPVLVATRED